MEKQKSTRGGSACEVLVKQNSRKNQWGFGNAGILPAGLHGLSRFDQQ